MKLFSRLLRVVLATLISFMTLALIAQTPAAAADGDLDTSFSSDGWIVVDSHASGEDGIIDTVIDASGRVITGGYWNNNGNTGNWSWQMLRYTAAGTCTAVVQHQSRPHNRSHDRRQRQIRARWVCRR